MSTIWLRKVSFWIGAIQIRSCPTVRNCATCLVVFGKTAIIWQIKDLKLDSAGKYKRAEVEKNIRQLSGARRRLFDLRTPITLENPRRGQELFNPDQIEEVFLISVLMGEGEEEFSFIEEIKTHTVHVFTREFTEIVFQELDTISDFVNYLREKQVLVAFRKQLAVNGSDERELLAAFLYGDRSFSFFDGYETVILDFGGWKEFIRREDVRRKLQADAVSYFWDELIQIVHTCGSGYEEVARELAKPNRVERRFLSAAFLEAQAKAQAEREPEKVFRRVLSFEGVTYCFVFANIARDVRKEFLEQTCMVARGKFKENNLVIGVATEKSISGPRTFDFGLFEVDSWTAEHEKVIGALQAETGILTDPEMSAFSGYEYPE